MILALILMTIGLSCTGGGDRASFPANETVSVPDFRGTAIQLAELLRKDGVPISIIQAARDPIFELDEKRIIVRRLLERVEKLAGVYRLEWIDGRAVLYPRALPYDREMKDVAIVGMRRFDAIVTYLKLVRENVPEIPLIAGPMEVRVGLTGPIPLYDDPVTLKSNGRVIDHLVQLLGSDERYFFVIKKHPGLKRPVGAVLIMIGGVERSQ